MMIRRRFVNSALKRSRRLFCSSVSEENVDEVVSDAVGKEKVGTMSPWSFDAWGAVSLTHEFTAIPQENVTRTQTE